METLVASFMCNYLSKENEREREREIVYLCGWEI